MLARLWKWQLPSAYGKYVSGAGHQEEMLYIWKLLVDCYSSVVETKFKSYGSISNHLHPGAEKTCLLQNLNIFWSTCLVTHFRAAPATKSTVRHDLWRQYRGNRTHIVHWWVVLTRSCLIWCQVIITTQTGSGTPDFVMLAWGTSRMFPTFNLSTNYLQQLFF